MAQNLLCSPVRAGALQMEMKLVTPELVEVNQVETTPRNRTRRKNVRFPYASKTDWDFFTGATGAKSGFVENVSQGGCLLRSAEPIEHRRWLRLAIRDEVTQLYFTAVGRIARREDKLEAWADGEVTLYRYGIEFIHALNPLILDRIQNQAGTCTSCGNATATIPDLNSPHKLYCVLCHLRRACQNLLVQDGLDSA